MHSLYVEHRIVYKVGLLSQDVAQHLFTRQARGHVVVVTDRPSGFMGAVKKQWSRVIRQAQNERSRTLDLERIDELSNQISRMQHLRFSAKPIADVLLADVTFAPADQLSRIPPMCHTMYVTVPVPRQQLFMMTAWMPEGGLLVTFEMEQPQKTADPVVGAAVL